MPHDDSIFFRRESRRSYLDKPVDPETLQRIYEKVRWSPSCNNNQPWRMVFVARGGIHHRAFAEALADGNQWAAAAPILIAVCGRRADDYSREDNPVEYYQFDCGLATMSLLLAAVDEGLMAHPMAGYSAPKVKAALEIPEDFEVLCVVSLGYKGPLESLDDITRKKDESPRTRKPQGEVICEGLWKF